MSNTPLAGKTPRWRIEDVIVVLKACGADEARLRDESYLLEELRRIDAQVMDQWLAILASFRARPRVKLFGEALSYLGSPNYDEERDAIARGSHMQLADFVFAQAWKRSNYPKAVELARRHDLRSESPQRPRQAAAAARLPSARRSNRSGKLPTPSNQAGRE